MIATTKFVKDIKTNPTFSVDQLMDGSAGDGIFKGISEESDSYRLIVINANKTWMVIYVDTFEVQPCNKYSFDKQRFMKTYETISIEIKS